MASSGLTQQQRLEQWEAWMHHVPRARRRETDRRRSATRPLMRPLMRRLVGPCVMPDR